MSAFGGKADIAFRQRKCLLVTQSGHEQITEPRFVTSGGDPLLWLPHRQEGRMRVQDAKTRAIGGAVSLRQAAIIVYSGGHR